jgi:F-type H+-transporting ATPase subunit alpha
LYCGTNGLLRNTPLEKVHEFETEFLRTLEMQYQSEVLDVLKKGIINDDVTDIIKKVAANIVLQ